MTRMICGALALIATAASAQVKSSSPTDFAIERKMEIAAPAAKLYQALGQIGSWWSNDHTYSGDAHNLSLSLDAGGCFCERWAAGSVAHGTVLIAKKNDTVRIQTALGPLQQLPVIGVLTFTLVPSGLATKLKLEYVVSGPESAKLDGMAGMVDRVLSQQLVRLARFTETGRPD